MYRLSRIFAFLAVFLSRQVAMKNLHHQTLLTMLLLASGVLAACRGGSAWRSEPTVVAARVICKSQSGVDYDCIERQAVAALNPGICRLAGISIDDMCLQAVYEAAGDPAICDQIYLQGVVPNCRAYYAQPTTTPASAATIVKTATRTQPAAPTFTELPTATPTSQLTPETIAPPVGLIFRIYGNGLWVINQDVQPQSLGEAEGLPSPQLRYIAYPDFEASRNQVLIVDLSDDSQRVIELPGRMVGCFIWQSETHLLCGIRFEEEEDAPDLGHLTRIGVEDGTVQIIEYERWLFSPPAVSPDGQTIAFDGSGQEVFLWQDGAVEPFAHTSYSGMPEGGLRRISSPSFSPDGTRLALFVGIDTSNAIAIFDMAAGTVKLLHEFEPNGFGGYFPSVVWSPDSRWFAAQVIAYPSEQSGLWLIAADGSQELQLGDRTMQTPLWLSELALLYTRNAEGKLSTIEQYDLVSGQIGTLAFPEGAYLIGLHR